MPTQEQFYRACHQFLPKGRIWPDASESANINDLVQNIAFAAKAIDDDASAELEDIFPDSAGNYLDDWERVLDLPKSIYDIAFFIAGVNLAGDPLGVTTITTPTPSTDDERRAIILAMLNAPNGGNNAQFYIDLASVFNMTITVSTGVSALNWSITVTADPDSKQSLFEAYAQFFKPAHTKLEVF
jgi:uncharacterized protein YmfQ (DUF2313 family)